MSTFGQMHFLKAIFSLLLFFVCDGIAAQSVLNFTVKQNAPLVADAGGDKEVEKDSRITLGATTPATGGSGTYQFDWSPTSDLENATVSNPIATITADITYTLIVLDSKGCSASSQANIKVENILANTESTEVDINLYPNPSGGEFVLESDLLINKDLQLEVIDPLGKNVFFKSIDGHASSDIKIVLNDLPPGLYILIIRSDNMTVMKKVQIQKPLRNP